MDRDLTKGLTVLGQRLELVSEAELGAQIEKGRSC